MEKGFNFNTHPLTSRLTNVESAGQDKWRASCPCGRNHKNADKNQSLTVEYDREKETLLVYCFTGCSVAEICQETGCSVSDLFIGKNPAGFISWFAEKNGLTFVESYSYCYGSYNDGLCKVRFRQPDGTKDFRWICEDDTKKSGFAMHHSGTHRLYVAGNINNNTVFVVEGEKDANTVHNLINATAVSAENGASRTTGGKWRAEYNQQLTGKNVYILWDNDDIGKEFALVEAQQIAQAAAAVFLLDLPQAWQDCPEKADITDYVKAVGPEEAAQTLAEMIANAEEYTAPDAPVKWDDMITQDYPAAGQDPQQDTEIINGIVTHPANPDAAKPAAPDPAAPWEPIEKGKRLPVFPLERFPGWIQEHITNYSASTGVNTDYCAAAVLGTISAVVVGHCDIPFNGDHREPAQLYTLFVGSSGTMKSSVIRHFMEPAADYLRRNNELTTKTNYAISQQIEELEKQLSAEQKAGKKGNPERIREITAQLEQKRQERHNAFPVPLDDVTPESLVNSMKYSRGTANIATAEGNIINVICGRSYTQRGAVQNIDVFLKGADAESIHQSRVTSGETDIRRADISMLLAVQPALLERLCSSADAVGRGLAQRFLIYAQEEQENNIDHTIPVYMDPAHAERWKEHIQTIAARFMDPDSPAKLMELEPAADEIIRGFWNYEDELKAERGSADEESITGWISKLHGKALRVAALLALLRDKNAQTIAAEDAENAVYLFKNYYIPQFIGAYEKVDILTREQRQIVNWIVRRAQRTGNQERFTEHELWIDVRQRVAFSEKASGPVKFRAALDDLRAKNFIRPAAAEKTGSGRGRPAKAWQINPEVYIK